MLHFIRIFLIAIFLVCSFQGELNYLYSGESGTLPSGGGYFLAVGTDNSSNGAAYISFNGRVWEQVHHSSLERRSPHSICPVKDKIYIGFGDGTILSAPSWKIVKRGKYRLRHITFGNGIYVAVGSSGRDEATALWSMDCKEWHTVVLNGQGLSSVAYGNDRFVAVGAWGLCFTSKDGKIWKKEDQIDRNNFLSIVFHKGRFYASGSRDAQFISSDGKNWAPAPGPYSASGYSSWVCIAFGRDSIVASDTNKPAARFKKRSNGLIFVNSHPGSPKLKGVTYGNGIFAGCGRSGLISWSPDGKKWHTTKQGMETLNSIAFGRGTFVIAGDGGSVRTSRDAKKWRTVIKPCNSSLKHVAYLNDRFIAVGRHGRHLWSRDGHTWFDDYAESFGVYSLAYGKGTLVAAGSYGRRAYLANGSTSWTSMPGISTQSLHCLEFGNNRFVLAGSNYFGGPGRVMWSPDGRSWRNDTLTKQRFAYMAYGNGRFVTVNADGSTSWSIDGIKWHTSWKSGYWYNIIFGKGMFLALKRNRRIYLSKDGVRWSSSPMPQGDELVTAAWGKNLFVAGGDHNRIAVSKNGKQWKTVNIPQPFDKWGNKTSVIFHKIKYIP